MRNICWSFLFASGCFCISLDHHRSVRRQRPTRLPAAWGSFPQSSLLALAVLAIETFKKGPEDLNIRRSVTRLRSGGKTSSVDIGGQAQAVSDLRSTRVHRQ
jgi:hypothetical protein